MVLIHQNLLILYANFLLLFVFVHRIAKVQKMDFKKYMYI